MSQPTNQPTLWRSNWALSEDGTLATHSNGLRVHHDGIRATAEPETVESLRQAMIDEMGSDRRFGAELYGLMAQAEKLFSSRHSH